MVWKGIIVIKVNIIKLFIDYTMYRSYTALLFYFDRNVIYEVHVQMEHGDSNSDALICFDTKFKSKVYLKLIESYIDFKKLSRYQHNKRLVECSEAHCFDAQFV